MSMRSYRMLGHKEPEFLEKLLAMLGGSQPAAGFDYSQQVIVGNDSWLSRDMPARGTNDGAHLCPLSRLSPLAGDACPAFRVKAERSPLHLVTCMPRHDRRVLPMRMTLSPLLNSGGDVMGIVVRDLGPESGSAGLSETESSSGNRLDVLVGGIAHDFNNLLVGILGFASLAEDMLEPHHPAATYVAGIRQSAEQAARLTRELMCYALGSSPETEVLDLESVVTESLEVLSSRLRPSIRIVRNQAQDLRALRADPAQVRQVVINICLNALEAMASEGTLAISTREFVAQDWIRPTNAASGGLAPGHYARLTVRDTGGGMDEATVAHLFEPYVSAHRFGRGLGLPAVAGIMREHGGAIRVETQRGHGTRFDVFFPSCEGRPEVKPIPPTRELPRGTETILVLDDEDRVRRMLSGALNRLGYQCLEATSAAEAESIYAERWPQIDLVVLDMVMPDVDGEEVFERLRAINPQIRCVMSSGYSRSFSLNRQMVGRLAGFIQKPYNLQTLGKRIREALDRPLVAAAAPG